MSRPLSSCAAMLLVFFGCTAAPDVAPSSAAVVYGEDDREEVFEHASAPHRFVAENAVAVAMSAGWIDDSNPRDVRITYRRTLGDAQDLCRGVAFAEQIEPGTCSGTLIDEQHLLTAAHCVDDADSCDGSEAWVFGFRLAAPGTLATLTSDDVYRCASIVVAEDDGEVDYAVLRLDRPVVGRDAPTLRPLPLGLSVGTSLTLIGHPNGIPMKIADGGEVRRSDRDGRWLSASVDAFSGNSGSGVFDDEARLVALLDSGDTDYVSAGRCNVVNVIDDPDDRGEGLTYLAPALEAFCATPGVDAELCGCDGPCVAQAPGDRCETAESIDARSMRIEGSLDGFTGAERGSCAGNGPDRHYRIVLPSAGRLRAEASGFDTVLYLRGGADGCGAELACNDDISDAMRGSRIDVALGAGTYVLSVDAFDGSTSRFTLDLELELDAGSAMDAGPAADAGLSDAGSDAGLADAGAFMDAGIAPARDASPRDGAPSIDDGGGGCSAAASTPWMLSAALLMLRRRRRRP
ncbi:MAG: serine protease [Myxococcota bacterium]